jgi:hypothetical protein
MLHTNIGDSILHAGIGGPAGGVLAVVHGEPDLEEVEGVEQHGGGHAPTHTRHQVLYPAPKSKCNKPFYPVLGIRDILMQIRIRTSD